MISSYKKYLDVWMCRECAACSGPKLRLYGGGTFGRKRNSDLGLKLGHKNLGNR